MEKLDRRLASLFGTHARNVLAQSIGVVSPTVILLAVLSCAQPVWRAQYLTEQVNVATQDQVQAKFGKPEDVRPSTTGYEVWVYRIGKNAKYGDPATYGEGSVLIGSGECVAYVLTFDKQAILRSWLRQEC